jgi:hypothetical protein
MHLKVTFSDAERDALDEMRGGTPAATWVRQLVRDAAVAADLLSAPVDTGIRTVAIAESSAVAAPDRRAAHALAAVARRTGHKPGCKCLNCERERGNV